MRREHADKEFNKSVGAHEEVSSIKKGIANFSRILFGDEEDNEKTTSAAKAFVGALFNSGNSIDWTKESERPDFNLESGGRKISIRANKAGGFDVFDLSSRNLSGAPKSRNRKLNSKPIPKFTDAYQGANDILGGGDINNTFGSRRRKGGGSGGGSGGSKGGPSGEVSGSGTSRSRGIGRAAGGAIANSEGVFGGILNFFKYQAEEFKIGFVEGYDATREKRGMPTGKRYRENPQHWWEQRAQMATQYAIGTANFENAMDKIEQMKSDEFIEKLRKNNKELSLDDAKVMARDMRQSAKDEAWSDFTKIRDGIERDARAIGSSLDSVIEHVNKIKNPRNQTVLPPITGWPSKYGGRNRVRGLQKNLKTAKLKPYANDTFGGKVDEPQEPPKEEELKSMDDEAKNNQNKQDEEEWEEWERRKPGGRNSGERKKWENKYANMSSEDIRRDFMNSLSKMQVGEGDTAAMVLPKDWREQWRNSDAYVFFRQAELKENADKYEKFKDMSSSEIASEYVKNIGVGNFDLKKWRRTQEYQWFREKQQEEAQAANEERARERQREIELEFINFHETGEWPVPTSEDEGGEEEQEGEQEQQDPNIANPSGESGDGGGSGDDVPPEYREYLDSGENPPEGIPLLTGTKRGQEGSVARFYDKRVAAAKKQGGGGGGVASGGGGNTPPGAPREGQQQQMPLQMPLEMSNDNEMTGDSKMAKPVDDYKEMIEQAVDKAKQQQSKSKVRSAKAQARVAKAHANEAEANAEAAEQKAEEKIASILHKLDSNISELNARKNPEINSVLSKLDSTIRFAKSNTKKN